MARPPKSYLKDTHPHLEAEFVPSPSGKTFSQLSTSSAVKVQWQCPLGHLYSSPPASRTSMESGCSVCGGKVVLPGFNDLQTTEPGIAGQWHPKKNGALTTKDVTRASSKVVWWKCDAGHSWEASLHSRSKGSGCPVCSNRKSQLGVNDITVTHPDVAGELVPGQVPVTAQSNRRMKWKCPLGHEYLMTVQQRTKKGHGCQYCSGQKLLKGFNDLATRLPEAAQQWDHEKNYPLTPSEVLSKTPRLAWRVCEKGHSWKSQIQGWTRRGCPKCAAGSHSSKGEKEVASFIHSLGIETITSDRNVIKPLELDIYIPSLKIAVEFNGVYWHSETVVGRRYHHQKWKACKEAGIQLIQIWEDDWLDKREVVERMLRHKLGKSSSPVIPARKTDVADLTAEEARSFLDANHIQGEAFGSIKKGLTHEGELVAVMVLRKRKEKEYELVRYATSCSVPGGHSKLLKHSAVPGTTVVTFADHEVSDGSLYEKTGWEVASVLPPDYKYLQGSRRKHKFGFRLDRFKTDPELQYEEGKTETELAELNGLFRVWDSGKTKYQIIL